MATIAEFEAALAAIDAATNSVADEVARLRALITGAGIDAAQEAVILQAMADIEARLRAIAAPESPA